MVLAITQLPPPASSCPHRPEMFAAVVVVVFPSAINGRGAGQKCSDDGGTHSAAARPFRPCAPQQKLGPLDDLPQPAEFSSVEGLPDDVGGSPNSALQSLRHVAGDPIIPREDCIIHTKQKYKYMDDVLFFLCFTACMHDRYRRLMQTHAALRAVLTVDDWDAQMGLHDSAEVEAAGCGSQSVDEDDVGVFESSGDELDYRRWPLARGHCK